jgi:nickel transport system ATP-binding protein
MAPFLETKNLMIRGNRDGRILVDRLSFSLEKGRKLAIVGESGSGKTLTSLAVLNLLPRGVEKISGEIFIDGKNTGSFSDEEWRSLRNTKISMVLQNPISAFDPVITIRSHFTETMVSHGMEVSSDNIRKSAIPALKEAGFKEPDPILDLYPFQMSGGMLQRVMIALALITKPSLLIADEDTTDLDVVSQSQVLDLIGERVKERGMALLLITHDLSVAAKLADDIIVMRRGKILETGEIDSVFHNPKNEYTGELIKAHLELYSQRFVKFMNYLEENEPCLTS